MCWIRKWRTRPGECRGSRRARRRTAVPRGLRAQGTRLEYAHADISRPAPALRGAHPLPRPVFGRVGASRRARPRVVDLGDPRGRARISGRRRETSRAAKRRAPAARVPLRTRARRELCYTCAGQHYPPPDPSLRAGMGLSESSEHPRPRATGPTADSLTSPTSSGWTTSPNPDTQTLELQRPVPSIVRRAGARWLPIRGEIRT